MLQDAQAEYLGLEPIVLEAHQRYLTRNSRRQVRKQEAWFSLTASLQ